MSGQIDKAIELALEGYSDSMRPNWWWEEKLKEIKRDGESNALTTDQMLKAIETMEFNEYSIRDDEFVLTLNLKTREWRANLSRKILIQPLDSSVNTHENVIRGIYQYCVDKSYIKPNLIAKNECND